MSIILKPTKAADTSPGELWKRQQGKAQGPTNQHSNETRRQRGRCKFSNAAKFHDLWAELNGLAPFPSLWEAGKAKPVAFLRLVPQNSGLEANGPRLCQTCIVHFLLL